jgi:hypothetical protein
MYPPSAPIYHNTRPLWYGDSIISRMQLKELKLFAFLKIERVRTKDGISEYLEISSDKKYYNIRLIRSSNSPCSVGIHISNFWEVITWLHCNGWDSVL